MVRLKVQRIKPIDEQITFQFHYGTIKSYLPFKTDYDRCLFQFHYGTIKSIWGKIHCNTS